MRKTVRDVMTTRVVSVRQDAPVKAMAEMLMSRRISAFPVLSDAGRVIGIVSEGDLLVKVAVQAAGTSVLAALRHRREDDKARGVTAGDLMSKPPITIGPEASVEAAARVMYDRGVKRLPVVDQAGRLLGIVSRVDLLSVYRRPDAEIRDEITHQALPSVIPGESTHIAITVKDGIVTLSGGVVSPEARRAAMDAARQVQGVVAVRNRFG